MSTLPGDLTHRGRPGGPASGENCVHARASPPPRLRRRGAACTAHAARAGPHRRDLAVRAGGVRRLRRRHRRVADDRDDAAGPRTAVPDRTRRAPQCDGRARSDPPVVVPTVGGLLLGLLGLAIVRYRPRRAVDPIEANALYGGRMSLNDSLIVVAQTSCQRRRRLGRAGGRLHPDRLRHGVPLRPHVPRAAQRPAAARRLRRLGRHRRRLRCAAHRRLLRLRTGDRHLHARHSRPGRGRRRRRRSPWSTRSATRRSISSAGPHAGRNARLHPDPGARHGVRPGRHRASCAA